MSLKRVAVTYVLTHELLRAENLGDLLAAAVRKEAKFLPKNKEARLMLEMKPLERWEDKDVRA